MDQEIIDAQIAAADATQKLAEISQYQTVIAAIGSIALIIALLLNIQSNYYTRKALKITERTSINQLRAYVFVDVGNVVNNFRIEPGKPPMGSISIKNYGETPAKEIWMERGTFDGPYPLPGDFKLPASGKADKRGGAFLPPKTSTMFMIYPEGAPVTQMAFDELRAGSRHFYIWGRIRYIDVFEQKRHSEFCLSVDTSSPDQSRMLRYENRFTTWS